MRASYVVTGASGFVGGHLIEYLAMQGIPAIAVARQPLHVATGITPIVVEDYRNTPIPRESTVLHLAESPIVTEFGNSGQAVRQAEVVLDLLKRRPTRLVYLSSALVYGEDTERPHQPDEPVRPITPYAAAKVHCERLVLEAGGIVLRAANLYGQRMAPNTVISGIIRQLGRPDAIKVRSASPIRDYLWIGDAVDALARAATSHASGCYNIGSGVGISVGILIRAILAVAGESHRPVQEASPAQASAIVLDINRTRDVLGWEPKTPLDVGLRQLIRNKL
jgi:UDP-glucose 4-epimerase